MCILNFSNSERNDEKCIGFTIAWFFFFLSVINNYTRTSAPISACLLNRFPAANVTSLILQSDHFYNNCQSLLN